MKARAGPPRREAPPGTGGGAGSRNAGEAGPSGRSDGAGASSRASAAPRSSSNPRAAVAAPTSRRPSIPSGSDPGGVAILAKMRAIKGFVKAQRARTTVSSAKHEWALARQRLWEELTGAERDLASAMRHISGGDGPHAAEFAEMAREVCPRDPCHSGIGRPLDPRAPNPRAPLPVSIRRPAPVLGRPVYRPCPAWLLPRMRRVKKRVKVPPPPAIDSVNALPASRPAARPQMEATDADVRREDMELREQARARRRPL